MKQVCQPPRFNKLPFLDMSGFPGFPSLATE